MDVLSGVTKGRSGAVMTFLSKQNDSLSSGAELSAPITPRRNDGKETEEEETDDPLLLGRVMRRHQDVRGS